MKKLDLRFGNPAFIQELTDAQYYGTISSANQSYDHTAPQKDLIESILSLHEQVGNVLNIHDYDVVISNGASQMLTAVSRAMPVGVYIPFWSRFRYLVEDMQVFTREFPHDHNNPNLHKLMVTYPNNPDGKLSAIVNEAKVVDASYHWPTFYRPDEKLVPLNNDVLIFSFSKLSGMSSVRLGWALVKKGVTVNNHEDLAKVISSHIEMSTCGVSPLAQQVAVEFIEGVLIEMQVGSSILDRAREVLNDRINEFYQAYPTHIYGEQRGMFAYIKDPTDTLDQIGVEYYRGRDFGDSDSYIRLNIGGSAQEFRELMARLLLRAVTAGGV
jgi:aspartate/methionine/tyrosine aminotransferase